MSRERMPLPAGTFVSFDSGSTYLITGAPIGFGGGSILYPARKQCGASSDGIGYVLKECYPVSTGHLFHRDDRGEIVPDSGDEEDIQFLQRAKSLQLTEGVIGQKIYQKASRMIPIRDSSQIVSFTFPDHSTSKAVDNTFTVMDALTEKGRSLSEWVAERRRFVPAEAFRIVQQLLFALREVHQAGYLHLDIQDGNIFLRGTLQEKDELVTLIDFGCARELINGKTAPIRDKVIYTTQGYFAPEILLHNDGNLQLGPEADIFSVGCLALFLLTGQRANVRELMETRTGIYLKPNQFRRIKCPKHLAETLQRILAKALAKKPEDRYNCVDAMLADVTELVDALQPYRSDLRATQFDAFVCYKHGPVDSAAALTVQRALENYRAPRGICEMKKPFKRVFVDEGELSSCADFGQQIQDALKNSGWLIVICSPDTPLSPWVQKEIDTFLEHHDRSRILALLTGGSPDQSFPPQLRGNKDGEGEVFAAHALGTTVQEVIKKIRGDSLLKLVAPMLGTTYDALKQRQKIYRLQRLAMITAGFLLAAISFGAYAMNRANVIAAQAVRIEEEYEKVLINESLFLSEQAEKLLADNPLAAMELALKALPSENQDRPLLTEAEYILGKALGIYTTPSKAEDTVTAVGIIDTQYANYSLSEDGKKVLTWGSSLTDYGSVVECWDAEKLTIQWTLSMDSSIFSRPLFSSDGRVYIVSGNTLYNVSTETGEQNWSIDFTNYGDTVKSTATSNSIVAFSLSDDESKLLVIYGDKGTYMDDPANQENPHRLIANVLSAQNGKVLNSTPFQIDGDRWIVGDTFCSPDLRYAVIPSVYESHEFDYYSHQSLHLVDLQTGNCTPLFGDEMQIQCAKFVDGRLAVLRVAGYTLETQHNVTYKYDSPYTCRLEVYDIEKCNLLWHYEFAGYLETGGIETILPTTYPKDPEIGSGLLFVLDDHCVLMDLESGELIRQYILPAAAASISLTTKGFSAVLTDGSCAYTGFGIDTLVEIPYMNRTVSAAYRAGEAYFIQSSISGKRNNRIYKYQQNWFDDGYQQNFDTGSNSWDELRSGFGSDHSWAVLSEDNQVCRVDLKHSKCQTYPIPEQYEFSTYQIMDVSDNGQRLYWTGTALWDNSAGWISRGPIYVLDFESGVIKHLPQPPQPHTYMYVYDTVLYNDTLLIVATWYDEIQDDYLSVYSWNLLTGTCEEKARIETPIVYEGNEPWQQESYISDSLSISSEQHRLTFAIHDFYSRKLIKLVSLDLETGKTTEIRLDIPCNEDSYELWKSECYQWNYNCTQAVFSYDNHIMVVDLDGNILFDISPKDEIVSAQYTPNEQYILTVTKNGVLSKYRVADAACIGSLDLSEHCATSLYISEDDWNNAFLNQTTMMAIIDSSGFLIDVSEDQLKIKAVVNQCIGYDPTTDRFFVAEANSLSGSNFAIGSFPRYTVEDLIRKANAILYN